MPTAAGTNQKYEDIMSIEEVSTNKETLKAEVLSVYDDYIASFNAGDADACVANFLIPYFDLRSVDGTPTQVVFATKADSRKYFTDSLEAIRAAGWDGSSRVVQTEVWELGSGMVSLLVDFERLTSDGSPIDAHR
ncbi:hypothetical protein, partial [Arthrobacter sp. ISL-28]|uniref:hypothetical protein n=1 Tax=Arthrobacter sp. ISL-28 TaxID=2819108 RepID=UPI001BE6507A